MSIKIKNLEKMRNNPRDWRIDELEAIAKHYNINVRKSGGSHVVFDHPKWDRTFINTSTSSDKTNLYKKISRANR